jgi:hypothetical protein
MATINPSAGDSPESPTDRRPVAKYKINLFGTKLKELAQPATGSTAASDSSRPPLHQSTKPFSAGLSVLGIPGTPSISVDSSHLPNELVIVINNKLTSSGFFLLFGCLVPSALGILSNQVGSIDVLHFRREAIAPPPSNNPAIIPEQPTIRVTMTRTRKSFFKCKVESPVVVRNVGTEEDGADFGAKKEVEADKEAEPEVSGGTMRSMSGKSFLGQGSSRNSSGDFGNAFRNIKNQNSSQIISNQINKSNNSNNSGRDEGAKYTIEPSQGALDNMIKEDSSKNEDEGFGLKRNNLVVIDGQTGGKAQEDKLIINGKKMLSGLLRGITLEEEGEVSALVKSFCSFPLTYHEFDWVESHASCFLPDPELMDAPAKKLYNIHMLQMNLQRIQLIQEKQSLGTILREEELYKISQFRAISDKLAILKFNLTMDQIKAIMSANTDEDEHEESDVSDDDYSDSAVEIASEITERSMNYTTGRMS